MPHLLRITPEAERDVQDITRRTLRLLGPAQYERYYTMISRAFALIAEDPLRAGSRSVGNIREGMRTFHLRSVATHRSGARHLVVYWVDPDSVVWIVGLLHDAMDLPRQLRVVAERID